MNGNKSEVETNINETEEFQPIKLAYNEFDKDIISHTFLEGERKFPFLESM